MRFEQAIALIILAQLGCVDLTMPEPAPMRVALAVDVSKSYQHPGLDPEDVDRLVATVSRQGGAIAFAVIDEKADEPLARLELMPVTGRLDERAKAAKTNQARILAWKEKVLPDILRKRDAKLTDLGGVISRLGLYFSEDTPGETRDVLILLSDCQPDPKGNVPSLPDGVMKLVVGAEPEEAKKVFKDALVLESFAPALTILNIRR